MALKLKAGGSVLSVSATTGKLSCDCCCYPTCPIPTIQWKSRSASKTKSGHGEFTGYVSTPPKRYLTNTWSGNLKEEQTASFDCSSAVTRTYDNTSRGSSSYDYVGGCTTAKYIDRYTDGALVGTDGPFSCIVTDFIDGIPILSATLRQASVSASCLGYSIYTDDRSSSLSSEYTTATLKSNTTADLSAYTATWTGTAGSYYNLTTDELTNSIRQAKYRFEFTVPEMCGAAMCYKIEWTEGSTAMSYTYTGTDPAGTTLYTGEYEIAIPTTNSTVTVTGISSACTGCP